MAFSELHSAFAPAVADQDFRQQLAQLGWVFGGAQILHEFLLKGAVAAQLAGFEERDQVVKLLEVVLDRCGGKHQTVLFLQRIH